MEISEHELGRLVAQADDEHRASLPTLLETVAADIIDPGPARQSEPQPEPEPAPALAADRTPTAGRTRRQVLTAGAFGGVALTIGSAIIPLTQLVSPVAAQEAAKDPTDPQLAAFAESVELALAAVYAEAAASSAVTVAAVRTAFTTFAGHHQQHAAAFSALGSRIGAASGHRPNPKLLDVGRGQLEAARDTDHALDLGFLLESTAAATYVVALGIMKSVENQRLSASVLPVESQHAGAFGVARGMDLEDIVPTFITVDRALDITKYPAA